MSQGKICWVGRGEKGFPRYRLEPADDGLGIPTTQTGSVGRLGEAVHLAKEAGYVVKEVRGSRIGRRDLEVLQRA